MEKHGWAGIITDPGSSTPDLVEDPLGRRFLRSWLTSRLVVGVLGLALPVLLIGGDLLVMAGGPGTRPSLSAYYYSGMRDVFVGILCVIGLFLVTYKVYERDWENGLSVVAGVSAVLIALFPTLPEPGDPITPWQQQLGITPTAWIHYVATGFFVVTLAVVSYRFGHRDAGYGNPRHAVTHRICGTVMIGAMALFGVLRLLGVREIGGLATLLLAELICVVAFSVSWLLKGMELRRVLRDHMD